MLHALLAPETITQTGDARRSPIQVYLPAYGWAAIDEASALAWQAQGYDVVQIPGFATNAMYGGALRCSVKVLRRSLDKPN